MQASSAETPNAQYRPNSAPLRVSMDMNGAPDTKKLASKSRFEVTRVSSDETVDSRRKVPTSIFDEPGGAEPQQLNVHDFKETYERVNRRNSLALYDNDAVKLAEVIGKQVSTNDDDDDIKNRKANLGTFFGVFLPCCQNIVGVIFFVRLPWIVGTAGVLEGALIVGICNMISVCTALSMSAIATNGRVTAGGTYFMISRSLGPSFGGSVGFLFFMGTSISVAMYYLGTVETFLKFIAPDLAILKKLDHAYEDHDYRLYGTILLLIMATVVFIGVQCVSRFAFCAILFLVTALFSVFIGLALANPETSNKICVLGDRAVRYSFARQNGEWECNKNETGALYKAYCTKANDSAPYKCDPYFEKHETKLIPAVPGFQLSRIKDSWDSSYADQGKHPGTKEDADKTRDIYNDICTSFFILIAIYFPSITGVESGSNYSGDLKDAQVSIPIGTVSAVIVTSTMYLSTVFIFSGCVEGVLLRDKYGQSMSENGNLVLSLMAWPSHWVVLTGTLTATIGAGLQALAGGPRLLQAIAEDNIIPNLHFFAKKWRGEPVRCLCFTFVIAEIGILIAVLDYVAPIVTNFFLMCYGFINFAVTLQSLLDTPHWRPRFKYYHWSLTLFGTSLCITVMFICHWISALLAIFIATCLYQYISYKGAEKEWGDGITGLSMTVGLHALSRIHGELKHIKNWRPQVLVLLKADPASIEKGSFAISDQDLALFSHSLKMGKGLLMFGTCLKGDLEEHMAVRSQFKTHYRSCLHQLGIHGFIEVIVHPSIVEGLCCMIQCAGLGALRPNTVLMGWPIDWIERRSEMSFRIFLDTMRNCGLNGNAVLVLKNEVPMPIEKATRTSGTIDIWWIVNDGGMLLLLGHLLRRFKLWSKCRLRLFSVAHETDNTVQIKKDLQTYLYQLRIEGTVEVVEMSSMDMSAYVYEQTLKMQERAKIINSLRTKGGSSKKKLGEFDVHDVYQKARVSAPDISLSMTKQPGAYGSPIDKSINLIEQDIRHVNTAVRMNEMMKSRSGNSPLVIVNLPCVPASVKGQERYMTFLELLCSGLKRVLMVRGTGSEVITVYN